MSTPRHLILLFLRCVLRVYRQAKKGNSNFLCVFTSKGTVSQTLCESVRKRSQLRLLYMTNLLAPTPSSKKEVTIAHTTLPNSSLLHPHEKRGIHFVCYMRNNSSLLHPRARKWSLLRLLNDKTSCYYTLVHERGHHCAYYITK